MTISMVPNTIVLVELPMEGDLLNLIGRLVVFVAVLWSTSAATGAACTNPCDDFMQHPAAKVDATNEVVAGAWSRLRAAAEPYIMPFPTLKVVAKGSACAYLRAAACPNNVTFVTREAVEICAGLAQSAAKEGVIGDPTLADGCLAFLMAHELGHHAQFSAMGSLKWGGKDFLEQLGTPDLEETADARGIFYMVLAGYDPVPVASTRVIAAFYKEHAEARGYSIDDVRARVANLGAQVRQLKAKALVLRAAIYLALFGANRTAATIIDWVAGNWALSEAWEWRGILEAKAALSVYPLRSHDGFHSHCVFVLPTGAGFEHALGAGQMRGKEEEELARQRMRKARTMFEKAAELASGRYAASAAPPGGADDSRRNLGLRYGARLKNNLACANYYLGRAGTAGDLLAEAAAAEGEFLAQEKGRKGGLVSLIVENNTLLVAQKGGAAGRKACAGGFAALFKKGLPEAALNAAGACAGAGHPAAAEKWREKAAAREAAGGRAYSLSCSDDLDDWFQGGEEGASVFVASAGPRTCLAEEVEIARVPEAGVSWPVGLLACRSESGRLRLAIAANAGDLVTIDQIRPPEECTFSPGSGAVRKSYTDGGARVYLLDEEKLVFIGREGRVLNILRMR